MDQIQDGVEFQQQCEVVGGGHCNSLYVAKPMSNQASDRKRTQILLILRWFTAASTAWANILRLLTLL